MTALFGIIVFVAILYVGRRLLQRKLATSVRFVDAMRHLGFDPVEGATDTFQLERGKHFVTIRRMADRTLATVIYSTTAAPLDQPFTRHYVPEGSKLVPSGVSGGAAAEAVDAIIVRDAKRLRGVVGLSVGPGIVSALVVGFSDGVLARQALAAVPVVERLYGRIDETSPHVAAR